MKKLYAYILKLFKKKPIFTGNWIEIEDRLNKN